MSPIPPALSRYWQNAFDLEAHLASFLGLDGADLQQKLKAGQQQLAELGRRDFRWDQADQFYRDQVGSTYLLDLAAWHLSSTDYIGNTLRLLVDHARGLVLDFGGGIGTHAIGAALCPAVEQVIFWDLNPIHRQLMKLRAEKLDLTERIWCPDTFPAGIPFDTLVCFDVMEHLPNPVGQLRQFHDWLKPEGKLVINWYFFKGFQGEFPFHLDDPQVIEEFFRVLQSRFLEVFHPYLITSRCYRKWPETAAEDKPQ
ncbi:class I SAM-dependent methyltransferase [Synechococcus sp. Nb3U1]|uniref:class I SAM-dependent methyltransferase n=1 Tax=Synechococcus sp. Nb3U1 TaxID=1914529 RepID=UPI001F2C4B62|nr:methyltransferase domain-containing protein [Synechococcus sp. Nb3U1]MCF2970903.1 class I SAM-dependent methyltransferase [Synechococcus sp. Nb3U1]